MGRGDLKSASRFADVVALCDVDVNHAAEVAKQYATSPTQPEQMTDFRRVLDRKDVDVIINGDAGSLAHAGQSGGGRAPRRTSTPRSR